MRVFQPITRCTTERDARSGDVGADVGVGVRSAVVRAAAAVAASGSNGASLRAGSFDGDVGSVGSVSFPSARPDSALASSRD